jgi:hypothetical protein
MTDEELVTARAFSLTVFGCVLPAAAKNREYDILGLDCRFGIDPDRDSASAKRCVPDAGS